MAGPFSAAREPHHEPFFPIDAMHTRAILLFELPQPPDLGHGHLTVAFSSDLGRGFADPERPCEFWYRGFRVHLAQGRRNLFLG